jgi:putative endopeptidase
VVDFVVAQSSSELGAIYLRFQRQINGRQDSEQGWRQCVDVLSQNLPFAIGAIYVEKYFKADARASIEEMYKSIKGEFAILIANASEWIDESTRDKLLNKLQSLVPLIAYPDDGFDEHAIKEFYDGIKIDKDHYLRTLFQLRVIDADSKFRQSYTLTSSDMSNEWQKYLSPTSIASHYSASDNTIRKIKQCTKLS